MGRRQHQLFLRNGTWYARFQADSNSYRLSTGTQDQAIANQRLPIIVSAQMSWEQIQATTTSYNKTPGALIRGFDKYKINPPINVPQTADEVKNYLYTALGQGKASYNEESGEWHIKIDGDDRPTDFFEGIRELKRALKSTDQTFDITKFYNVTMPEHFNILSKMPKIYKRYLKARESVIL